MESRHGDIREPGGGTPGCSQLELGLGVSGMVELPGMLGPPLLAPAVLFLALGESLGEPLDLFGGHFSGGVVAGVARQPLGGASLAEFDVEVLQVFGYSWRGRTVRLGVLGR
jgi:hypothetical protein